MARRSGWGGVLGLLVILGVLAGAPGARAATLDWSDQFQFPGVGGGGVNAGVVFDDGSGSALYVGGNFTTAGGVAANSIAKWDGVRWTPVGGGTDGIVSVLAVFNDGSGAALYAAGTFTTAGGVAASKIAKWNGTA